MTVAQSVEKIRHSKCKQKNNKIEENDGKNYEAGTFYLSDSVWNQLYFIMQKLIYDLSDIFGYLFFSALSYRPPKYYRYSFKD